MCFHEHHRGTEEWKKELVGCFLGAQVPGSAMLSCNDHSSLESVALTFSALPMREAIIDSKHLSGVKHQAMAIISQFQNSSDSLATLRDTQSRGH